MRAYSLTSPRKFQDDIDDPGSAFFHTFLSSQKHLQLQDLAVRARKRDGHFPCTVLLDRQHVSIGKRNLVFQLRFSDGVIWAARLRNPLVNKTVAKDLAGSWPLETLSLESELATMSYVRDQTTIPVPAVYAFDCGYDNPVNCPYMLMEYIMGSTVSDMADASAGVTEVHMLKLHAQLANISFQLSRLRFPAIGQLRIATDSDAVHIGEIIDIKGRRLGPFAQSEDFYRTRAHTILAEAEEAEDACAKRFKSVAQVEERTSSHEYLPIQAAFLHTLAVESLAPHLRKERSYPLKHVDFHRQNVLVDKTWTIVGIIDWSWACTVPVESFRPLPFNLAEFILPAEAQLIDRHKSIFWTIFPFLEESQDSTHTCSNLDSLRTSKETAIVYHLDRYSWPAVRVSEAPKLAALVGLTTEELQIQWRHRVSQIRSS